MDKLDQQPLRQRKLARTRLALLEALTRRLETQTYEAVRIKDLCAAAEISEAGFFNHFERKEDLLVYFVQMWSLSVGWHAQRVLAERGALAAIADVFARTAAEIAAHPRVMAEVIAFQARMETVPPLRDPSLAERLMAFPELDGIEAVPALGLDAILPGLLAEAGKRREIAPEADQRFLFLHLAALFFGTPVALRRTDPRAIGPAWQAQLDFLFRASGAGRATPASSRRK